METCSNCHNAPEMCACLDKPGDDPERFSPAPGSPTFVFLDLNSEPWLVHNDWLHRWNRGAKCWVTARELRNFELGEMEKRKLKPEHAALYGPPCSENTELCRPPAQESTTH